MNDSLTKALKQSSDLTVLDNQGIAYDDKHLIDGVFAPRWLKKGSGTVPSTSMGYELININKAPFKGKVFTRRNDSKNKEIIVYGDLALYGKRVKTKEAIKDGKH